MKTSDHFVFLILMNTKIQMKLEEKRCETNFTVTDTQLN